MNFRSGHLFLVQGLRSLWGCNDNGRWEWESLDVLAEHLCECGFFSGTGRMGSGSLLKTILGAAWLVELATGSSGAPYAGGGILLVFLIFKFSLNLRLDSLISSICLY